jgi:hypothetical protein
VIKYAHAFALLVLLLGLLVFTGTLHAQIGRPQVAFVLENTIQTASVSDNGPDGLSRMADIFRALGADTRFIRLSEAIPDEVSVVVLPRPLRAIPSNFLARLWRHVSRGNSLLVLMDPVGYPSARTEGSSGGLGKLLNGDYGVIYDDSFVAEYWFVRDSIAKTTGSIFTTRYSAVAHPLFQPLANYQLDVQMWGARTVSVDALGIDSSAAALLTNETAFGETGRDTFATSRPQTPIEANLQSDVIGLLTLAGLGENSRTSARVAVIGDSEVLQNGYGLRRAVTTFGQELPLYPGNQVLAERLAAWLLHLPEEDWPELPRGFTWLVLDGDGGDWAESIPSVSGDGVITSVSAFRNDSYLYVKVTTNARFNTNLQLSLTLNPVNNGNGMVTVLAGSDGISIQTESGEIPVPDAGIAVNEVAEIRIPMRAFDVIEQLNLEQVCLAPEDESLCLSQRLIVPRLNQLDPAPLRLPYGPLVTVDSPSSRTVNLRRAPSTEAPVEILLNNGTLLFAIGRTEAGDWVKAISAGYTGWFSSAVITLNGDIMALPVVTE